MTTSATHQRTGIPSAMLLLGTVITTGLNAATVTGVGKEENTLIVTVAPTEVGLIEPPRLLIFEERESGRLFRGTVLRVGGTKAVIAIGFPPGEIGEGKTLTPYPPFKNDVYSPQMVWAAQQYQRRRSVLGLSGGAVGRRFAPQGESRTDYSGYAFSVDPEFARPTGFAVGARFATESLKAGSDNSAFPASLGRLAAEPHITAGLGGWLAVGASYRYWSIRHTAGNAASGSSATTVYDYTMGIYGLNAVIHGFGGEVGVGYETGAKVLPRTSSTAQLSSVKNTDRFLIQPPRVMAMGRWSLGGGLFGSIGIGRVMGDDALYEDSDLIRNTTAFDRTIWRLGTEILTAGGTKWEFVARHDDPLSLREGGQPLYTGTFGGTLAATMRWTRFLDNTWSVDAVYGSKLYHYEGVTEDQGFEATQLTVKVGLTWLLVAKDS